MGKPLYKLKKLCIILVLIFVCASVLPFAYPQTNAQETVNIEQISDNKLKISGTAAPNGRICIDIYRPGYDADDLISGSPIQNLSALAYHDQFGADENGAFETNIKINGESGIYTLCLGGAAVYNGEFYFENIPDTAGEEKEFSLNFEDDTLTNGGWDSLSGTGAEMRCDTKLGERVFSVKSGTAGYTELSKNLSAAAISGVYKLSFDFIAENTEYTTYITMTDTDGSRAEVMAIKQSGIGIMNGLTGYNPETYQTYSLNEKHGAEVYFDTDMRRAYWCYDGEYIGNTSINNNLKNIKKVSFHVNGKSDKKMYLDNVSVSKITSKGKNLEDINCGAYGINDTMWLTANGGTTGNIFSKNQNIAFDLNGGVRYGTRSGAATVTAEIYDTDSIKISEKTYPTEIIGGRVNTQIQIGDLPCGLYRLKLSLNIGAENAASRTIEFSVSNLSGGEKNRRSGVSAHFYNGRNIPEKVLEPVGNAGIGLIRDDIRWSTFEKQKGVYEISETLMKELEYAKENDIDVMLILGNNNTLYENTAPPTTDAALDAFEEYCYRAALKTKGYAKYFEVWNEFNHTDNKAKPGYTTQTYANILTRAYRAVKRANPDAVVFLGGLCRVGRPLDEDYEWLNELLPKITGENMCFDAVSIHPYRYSSPEDGLFKETITAFKEYLTSKGLGGVPLWISEMGWPSFKNTWTNITEKDQAEYLVRMLAINDAYSLADRVIWYDLENDGTLKSDNESNFGLLNNKAHIPAANSAKASYLAYANYNAMTYGYTPCGREERTDGTLVSKYENNGDMLYICQNASRDVSVNISDFSNGCLVYVYDIFGNAVEYENTVSVGKSPIYIEVKSANLTLTKNSDDESVIRAEIADKQFTDVCGGSAMLIVKQTEADERLANIYVSSDFKKVNREYLTQIEIGSSRDYDINAYLWGGINKMLPLVKPLTK